MHATELEAVKAKIFDYDLSFVTKRFSEEQNIDLETASLYESEIKKYFYLRFIQKRRYGMLGLADEYWHTFIIYTKIYHDFCEKSFGTYLHHEPADSKQDSSDIASNFLYIRFLVDYYRHFQKIPPKEIWPFSHEIFGEASDEEITGGICIAPCFSRCSV
jgi:hypothetical protein